MVLAVLLVEDGIYRDTLTHWIDFAPPWSPALSLLKQRTIERQVAVGHSVHREAGLDGGAAPGAIDLTDPSDGFDASSRVSTRKPVTPCSMSSDIEPRLKAITGVPHAIASTTRDRTARRS